MSTIEGRVQMARTPDEAAPAPQGNHPSENGDDMDKIEQLRSDLENAVLERDKALAELERLDRNLTACWPDVVDQLRTLACNDPALGEGDHGHTVCWIVGRSVREIQTLRTDRDVWIAEAERLLAELDMFRPVQIRAFTGDTMLVRRLDSDNKSELVSIPLKVFVKDDHV